MFKLVCQPESIVTIEIAPQRRAAVYIEGFNKADKTKSYFMQLHKDNIMASSPSLIINSKIISGEELSNNFYINIYNIGINSCKIYSQSKLIDIYEITNNTNTPVSPYTGSKTGVNWLRRLFSRRQSNFF